MEYVKILITTPYEEHVSAFGLEEFKCYIEQDILNRFVPDKPFTENFNDNSPCKNDYKVKVLKITDQKPTVDDANMDRLTLAEYAFNCYKDPEKVLSNISDKLYEYNHLFSGRKLTLNSMESIQHEKNALNNFYKNLQKASANYTERKSHELIDFVKDQSNRRRGR